MDSVGPQDIPGERLHQCISGEPWNESRWPKAKTEEPSEGHKVGRRPWLVKEKHCVAPCGIAFSLLGHDRNGLMLFC